MRGSTIRIVLTVLSVAAVSVAFAQEEGLTVAERAEIAAAEAAVSATGVLGAPVHHPDAWGGPEAVIYFSDFEADNGGLAATLDWEWGAYAWVGGGGCSTTVAPPAAPYSGANMWGTVLNTCYNGLGNNTGYGTCTNGNTADDSILSLTVDLTGYTDAQLSWWDWPDIFMNFDWGEVYANGTVVFQHCGSGYTAPSAWVQQVVDLTPYVGGTVTIEFHMMASTVVNYSGWYIDDLQVSGTPVPVELQSLSVE
ncbi:MAG TPA: hypothetical protein VLB51_05895 [Methylomirabilota bacterium]|nr:hypothetical protein [Methylomirabilota bacterium]